MKAISFAYWLQGYFELNNSLDALTPAQIQTIDQKLIAVKAGTDSAEIQANAALEYIRGMLTIVSSDLESRRKFTVVTKKRLSDLFIHAIDPSYDGDQAQFNHTHTGGKYGPGERC